MLGTFSHFYKTLNYLAKIFLSKQQIEFSIKKNVCEIKSLWYTFDSVVNIRLINTETCE